MTTSTTTLLDAALAYARLGWRVFPLREADKIPKIRSAHPAGDPLNGVCRGECGKEGHGCHDATTDEDKIRKWWKKWPAANIGIATGEGSGVDVLDLDCAAAIADNGLAVLTNLEAVYGQVFAPTVVTGGGGQHLYFRHEPGVQNRAKMLPGIDVRGDGGYVVAPPSAHKSGQPYAWMGGNAPTTVPAWPRWLLDEARKQKQPTPKTDKPGAPAVLETPAEAYGKAALKGLYEELASVAKGSRDDKRNAIAFRAGRLVAAKVFTHDAAVSMLDAACDANGLSAENGEDKVRRQNEAGVAAGVREGPASIVKRESDSRRAPAAERRHRAAESDDTDRTILLPGTHVTDHGEVVEVGTDDFAAAAVEALPDGAVYRMDSEVGTVEGPEGKRRFCPLDETATRILVDRHMRLGRWVKVKAPDGATRAELAFRHCGKDEASLVLSQARKAGGVRELQQIVTFPVYLPGLVLAAPGWNEAGGVYFDAPPDLKAVTPDPAAALEVLDDLVVDFPFKDAASRHNTFAGMLTLVLRPAIEGPVPFFLAMASMERTGKGKLIDTAFGVAVTGRTVPPMQVGRDESETEKRLTAQILHGTSLLHLDNVPIGEVLDSPSLASLATAWPCWSGRALGSSTIVVVPNRLLIAMSANNPRATGELVKRTVPIMLAPKSDHPELREDFVHPDALAYAALRRPRVLAALLGMVEAWKAAGKPAANARMGGFERWAAIVVSVMRHAGAADVLGNYREWCRAANDQQADIEALVEAWVAKHHHEPITAAQVLDLVEKTGTFQSVLAKPTRGGQMVALAKNVLTPLIDRPVKDWIVRRHTSGNNTLYRLDGGLFGPKTT